MITNNYTVPLLFFALLVLPQAARADLSLILNGKSFHHDNTDDRELNERNYGLGLQYDFERRRQWAPFATAATFRDSLDGSSWYAGGGVLRRFDVAGGWHVGIGAVVFVMRHSDINDSRPFLAALPAATIGTDRAALNITYIPRVKAKGAAAFFLQLRLRLL